MPDPRPRTDLGAVSRAERALLADAMLAAGPDAPTLCAGWSALDMAAHLYVRERRPDAGPGILLPPLARWTEFRRAGATGRGLPELVAAWRAGPPAWSPFRLVDRFNVVEHVIHHEDVRRGGGAGPREPGDDPTRADYLAQVQAAVWAVLPGLTRLTRRRLECGLVLERDDAPAHEPAADPAARRLVVATGPDPAVLRGAPVELILFLTGRHGAARVALEGSPASTGTVRAASKGY